MSSAEPQPEDSHLDSFQIIRSLNLSDVIGQLTEAVLPEGKSYDTILLHISIDLLSCCAGGCFTCSLQILEQERKLEYFDLRVQTREICSTGYSDIYSSLLQSLYHGSSITKCSIIVSNCVQSSVGILVDVISHSCQCTTSRGVLRNEPANRESSL